MIEIIRVVEMRKLIIVLVNRLWNEMKVRSVVVSIGLMMFFRL